LVENVKTVKISLLSRLSSLIFEPDLYWIRHVLCATKKHYFSRLPFAIHTNLLCLKESLKIPQRYSEAANQRKSDNAMVKGKRTKWQTIIYKILHRKLKIERYELYKNRWWTRILRKGSSSGSTCVTRVTLLTNPVVCHEWGKDRIVITVNGTYPWSLLCIKHID